MVFSSAGGEAIDLSMPFAVLRPTRVSCVGVSCVCVSFSASLCRGGREHLRHLSIVDYRVVCCRTACPSQGLSYQQPCFLLSRSCLMFLASIFEFEAFFIRVRRQR